ncbi:hypothetical protein HDV05_004742 [Chytridiales sp. JEL 0842]|nr:hypothetical protein HDV05_004742 [Chytridiales sp. JEL 0842]
MGSSSTTTGGKTEIHPQALSELKNNPSKLPAFKSGGTPLSPPNISPSTHPPTQPKEDAPPKPPSSNISAIPNIIRGLIRPKPSSSNNSNSNSNNNNPKPPPKQNMVLPSYEAELSPANDVSRATPPQQLYHRAMHYLNNLVFHPFGGAKGKAKGRLERVLGRFMRTPYDVRRVVVIGVHGWFPNKLVQRVVGDIIGTSERFADKMTQGTVEFFQKRYGIDLNPGDITKIPLKWEGKVEARVEMLYRQLTKSPHDWLTKLKEADLILVAAHSQGTPVSVMLFARLISEGLVDLERQKACILAMAGISHGPFPSMKSSVVVQYLEADAARELFEFNDWNSAIATKYRQAMAQVLEAGTRVVAVGSMYDQVVPLYSATMHAFEHPLIYRAFHIEGVDYNPDFFSHLVVFALRLRNAGISDRGLVVHLSDLLAGNVLGFGTQGHSTVYEELNTYTLAVAWAMGTQLPPIPPFPDESLPARDPLVTVDSTGSSDRPGIAKSTNRVPPPNHRPYITDPPSPFLPPPTPPILSSMSSTSKTLLQVHPHFDAPTKLNPNYIPWALAQIASDRNVLYDSKLRGHLEDLLKLFKTWDPSSRALKELGYRLEPLKARL